MKTFKNKKEPFRKFLGFNGLGLDDKFALSFGVYIINSIFVISAFLAFYTSSSLFYALR